jgi:hypothetical protein
VANPQLTHLKTYPELFDAASREGRDREYRLWLLARFLDPEGSGRVSIAHLQELANRERMRGLSRSSVCRLLQAGEGTFWHVYEDQGQRYVRLQGLASVCVALDVEKLRSNPVYIELRYARSLKAFRAACFYARFAGDKPSNPISRQTLEDLSGVKTRTQRSYARALGDRLDVNQNAATTSREWTRGDDVPEGHFVDYVDGDTRVLRRLPNSYQAGFLVAARGMMRHVNRRLRGNSARTEGAEERSCKRLFYRSQKASNRRMQRKAEGDWWYSIGGDIDGQKAVNASRCGAVLWTQNRIVNGAVYCG